MNKKKYHSIAVMRTSNADLANRFKHTIFTKDNKIVYNPSE